MTNERELYEKNPIHNRLSSEIAITIFSGGEWPQTPQKTRAPEASFQALPVDRNKK